uniref:(California timema) hypothetical protein n=1 Tax=Timema californicum TaxID=61474 RepID=A0A7R9P6I1_TIMCA|nr:unnamed protein product [Timema californicum]
MLAVAATSNHGVFNLVHGANTYFPSPERQEQFELMLKTAHSLRVNMIRVLGGILQSDHELSWEQLVTIRRLHQNLVSRQESAILLIPRAKTILNGLLQYLIWHVPMEQQVLHAVNTVVKHIQTDGIGVEPPDITIECTKKMPNITRESTAPLILKLDDKQSISMPYLFGTDYDNREDYIDSEELSIVIPRPCVDDGEQSEVLTVDLSSLFEAVENTVSKKALEKILEEENKKKSNTLPKIDWIEVLHVIPDEGVPIEVLFAKKDLYKFLMSVSFKMIMKDYRVDLTQTRAKFLKNILSYLRTKPEMQVVKESIAYVYWVIKEDGPGLMPVSEDVIWPEEEEEAQRGKKRASELLYQVLGLLKNDGAFEILQKLQQLFESSSNLDMGTTYIGYDVMEEFPPKERLLVILRRIYHNYLLFLSEDTAHAIDTVFMQLGEKREEMVDATFIPVDLEQLMKDVLGSYSPPFILDSAKRLVKLVDIKQIPLGKAFEDMVPSILKVNVRIRLAILLRIIWRAYSKRENAEVLHVTQMIYEYIQPSKLGTEMRAQDHHMTIIAALASLVKSKAPQRVQLAKRVTIGYLTSQQHAYDKALANLVTLNLSPLELVARALRRFRENQHEMNPQLWTAVSTIFEYLNVPEHESTEDITDDNFDVVEEFKDLVNEAGQDSESDKQLIVRYIVEKKDDLTKLFRGQRVLLQYSSRDKMVIILERLLRIYGKHLDPKIIDASERILRKLDVSEDESSEEVLSEDIDVVQILDSAVEESASNDVLNAKELVKKTLKENPIIKDKALEGIIIQKGFNNQRRCSLILRRLYRKFHHQLNKDISRAILKIFDYIKASVSNSAEDQFLGNFTFNGIFNKIFPDDEENDDVIASRKIVLDFLNAGTVRYEDILEGLHLWKLPLDTQAGLVLYRLAKHVNVTSELSSAIDTLIESLDTDLDELAAENKDESVKPNILFENVFGNTRLPAEVQEAQGLVIHILISGSSSIKDIYRGVDFSETKDPKDRLVAILKNIHAKRENLGPKISNALKILSAFLHVHLGDEDIDPYTFDFGGLFDMTIPSFAPQSVQRAKYKLLRAIKRRPGPFKKILENVIVLENETEQETTKKILKAIIHYKRQLSSKIRLATSLLIKFIHGDPIEDILGEPLESDEDENESIDDLISIRSLDYEKKTNEKRRWQKRRGARVFVKETKSSQETIFS